MHRVFRQPSIQFIRLDIDPVFELFISPQYVKRHNINAVFFNE